jgi:hypothetical protein
MLRFVFLFSVSVTLTACKTDTRASLERQIEDNPDIIDHSAPAENDSSDYDANNARNEEDFAPSSYSYKVIFDQNNGWGYQIFESDKMVINQTHIPAVPGVKGFSTEENAQITAEYLLKKIKEGIFPPTITAQNLDSLGVL